ncbi:MAG: hypothetical protein AAGE83_16050, partial [Pseudomonadota bacterium]
MVDILAMPDRAFGYVPTPALVAPIEFTMTASDYASLGGHTDYVIPLEEALRSLTARQNDHLVKGRRAVAPPPTGPWPPPRLAAGAGAGGGGGGGA